MVTDPISDMLVQLKNAAKVQKPSVIIPHSKLKMAVAKILQREGYLAGLDRRGKKAKRVIICDLSYDESGQSRLHDTKRISKPSRRIYQKVSVIKPVKQGLGLTVISTPKGLLTDAEARREGVGGEVMFMIW